MKYTLEIELGNDIMRTAQDVAAALELLVMDLRVYGWIEENGNPLSDSGAIRDINGDTVGTWSLASDIHMPAGPFS